MSNQSNSFPLAFRMFSSKQKFILIATAVLWAIILIVLIGGLMNVRFGEASRLLRTGRSSFTMRSNSRRWATVCTKKR